MAAKMEVDEEAGPSNAAISSSVMASSGTTGSVTVALHPLVIMNISEHWTRIRAQEGKPTQGNIPVEFCNFANVWQFREEVITVPVFFIQYQNCVLSQW